MSDEKMKINPFAAMAQAMGGMAPPSTAGMENRPTSIPLAQVFREYALSTIKEMDDFTLADIKLSLTDESPNLRNMLGSRLIRLALEMREKMLENIR